MSSNLRISAEEYMPLRDVVFTSLREAIIKGELRPGERLLEVQLAEQLGVSRTPIREAIRKLELEGLVIMLPRRGATVAGITKKHLEEVLEIRKALEVLAVDLACDKMTEENLNKLRRMEEEFELAIQSDDIVKLADLDEEFHRLIHQSGGNERLSNILETLREQIYRYRLEALKDRYQRKELVKQHRAIVEGIANHDKASAEEAIRTHITNQEETILRNLV